MFDRYKNYKYRKAQEIKRFEEVRLKREEHLKTFSHERYTLYNFMWKKNGVINNLDIRRLGKKYFEVLEKELELGIIMKHQNFNLELYEYIINKSFEGILLSKMIDGEEGDNIGEPYEMNC